MAGCMCVYWVRDGSRMHYENPTLQATELEGCVSDKPAQRTTLKVVWDPGTPVRLAVSVLWLTVCFLFCVNYFLLQHNHVLQKSPSLNPFGINFIMDCELCHETTEPDLTNKLMAEWKQVTTVRWTCLKAPASCFPVMTCHSGGCGNIWSFAGLNSSTLIPCGN